MVDVSDESIELPPGFRFHPTDEEIIINYLSEKVVDPTFTARAVGEVDLNKCEPWDLPKRAKMGEKEWYFFCQRDRKYPTGMRTNRATEAGYWKATGKDKEIYKGRNCLVGMKKTLVFYRGRAPKGDKSNWVMHEYRLEAKFSYHNLPKTAKDEWVVCRVFHKSSGVKKSPVMSSGLLGMNTYAVDELFESPSLPALLDSPYTGNTSMPSSSFIDNNSEDLNKFNGSDHDQFTYSNMDSKSFIPSNNYTIINNNTTTMPQNANYYPQIPFTNPTFAFQGSTNTNTGYLQPHMDNSRFTGPDNQSLFQALAATNAAYNSNRQCKVEQFSCNQSMVSLSQDTGLSTDINTEISSVASKNNMGDTRVYEDFEGPSSAGPVVGFESLWNY